MWASAGFSGMSGFSLAEGKGRMFPQEGKQGAKVGKEEWPWAVMRTGEATEDVCTREGTRGGQTEDKEDEEGAEDWPAQSLASGR